MAHLRTEAFSIAQTHDEMPHYAELLCEDANLEDCTSSLPECFLHRALLRVSDNLFPLVPLSFVC
jgi:hypothetical protein